MSTHICSSNSWSFNNGKKIIEEKQLLTDLVEIATAYQKHGGGNQYMSERAKRLDPLGWQQEVSTKFEAKTVDGTFSRRGSFDAYKDGVLVEHEKGEQMRANWHLMKMEAAYRESNGLDDSLNVEVGVLLIPDYVNFPTLGRTQNDVHAVLANYFDFSIPLFVWEYPTVE
ncbi:hypothetical protein [Halorussus amylolyticus]|uniref:hypothetical protein n=1 Tax=Halorussus amylolyticus TaxID=1126242 RepID=UPI0010520CE4|nr:hypothetical protein [Halorussus amylolyticus]